VLGTLVVVPAAWYILRFFINVMWGTPNPESAIGLSVRKGTLHDLNLGEFLSLAPLLILIFYIGVQPVFIARIIDSSVANTMQVLGSTFVK
jgi:NADH-quinone oxidoreductase subunit M